MILNDEEIQQRIESPINLLNRLRKTSTPRSGAIGPFTPSSSPAVPVHIPTLPPKAEDIVDSLEDKLANATARTKATSILVKAMSELEHRLPEVQKPETLARIATDMSKVISNQDAARNQNAQMSQIIVYAPQIQPMENYEVIDIQE